MHPNQRQSSLSNTLDRDILQIVRKLEDDLAEAQSTSRLDIITVYEYIRRSNSSLNRKNKRILEASIERVLDVLDHHHQQDQSDLSEIPEPNPVASRNSVNESIARAMTRHNHNGAASHAAQKRDVIPAEEPPAAKRRKQSKKDLIQPPPPGTSFDELGAIEPIIGQLTDLIAAPMLFPEQLKALGGRITSGVLLHGPPGCGKTAIANSFAAELGVSFMPISAPSIVSGMSGESEKKLRECFDEAMRMAPCIMFIDEIDVIAPKRDSTQQGMEKRIVAQLLTCFDKLAQEQSGERVSVIAATNRPDSLDPALRRAGRFDTEIAVGVPNEQGREAILLAKTRHIVMAENVSLKTLANRTPGYVGADLNNLVNSAATCAFKRFVDSKVRSLPEEAPDAMAIDNTQRSRSKLVDLRNMVKHPDLKGVSALDLPCSVSTDDFMVALTTIQPSITREGFATIPVTTWDKIGGHENLRRELHQSIVAPIANPGPFRELKVATSAGVLLWGPPGCGKTLIAKAVANESGAQFIKVGGTQLLSKWVGDSEKAVNQIFTRAKASAPCVVFFDEIDALVPARGTTSDSNDYMARVVNTMLTELDGVNDRAGVYVVAATNRPELLDPAMLRPGRLGKRLYVGLPTSIERADILGKLISGLPIAVNTLQLAEDTEGYSGADLMSLVNAAKLVTIYHARNEVVESDFLAAMGTVGKSVSDTQLGKFHALLKKTDWR
ncbi:MAG: hypothetical protein M1814_000759 [Vezdaea aestivalis]|nr:MAG: hypothetical protein M1814_000759 [Vezdaea aestivalis]